jgi:hypothetical protein
MSNNEIAIFVIYGDGGYLPNLWIGAEADWESLPAGVTQYGDQCESMEEAEEELARQQAIYFD